MSRWIRIGAVAIGAVASTSVAQIGDNAKIRITRNFSAEYNAKVMAIPEGERAWPAIRDASVRMPDTPEEIELTEVRGPAHEHWEYAVQYCRANADTIAEIRRALRRPSFGYLVSDIDDPEMVRAQLAQKGEPYVEAKPSENPRVIDLRYACIGRMRAVVRTMAADARVAAHDGDSARAIADVAAIVDAARLVRQLDHDIGELVVAAALSVASAAASDVVGAVPLTEAQLLELAGVFERMLSEHQPLVRIDLSRDLLLDLVQRIYEDDGSGDGRLTPAGVAEIDAIAAAEDPGPGDSTLQAILLLNTEYFKYFWANVATRRGVMEEFERIVAAPITRAPMWEWREFADRPGVDPDDKSWSMRYTLLGICVPNLQKVCQVARQAPLEARATAVALRLHARAAAGLSLPEDVGAMFPAFARPLPLDCFTGRPLCYQRRGEGFVIYSVGADRDDDGGRAPDCPRCARKWVPPEAAGEAEDGDWMLWPVP